MEDKKLGPVIAIRTFCMECNGEAKGGNKYDCLDKDCILYPWKENKGVYEFPDTVPQVHKNYISSLTEPVRKSRTMSEENKAKGRERMKAYWAKKKAKE